MGRHKKVRQKVHFYEFALKVGQRVGIYRGINDDICHLYGSLWMEFVVNT